MLAENILASHVFSIGEAKNFQSHRFGVAAETTAQQTRRFSSRRLRVL
ncbi:hypothetical protein Q669_16720 [Labrenzia sp. C1B10]|nr:hypothetical protein Q669_16720 [Labrenzia sp. C1B10]ERS06030.1 hypothetical protein Q675_27730 [Labrenzia sp. C1B70]